MPDRYQEEIEEILSKAGDLPAGNPAGEREKNAREASGVLPPEQVHEASTPAGRRGGRRWPTLSSGKILLLGLVLLVVGAFSFRALVWVGLAALVIAYLLFFVKPRSLGYDKYWRGRSVDETSSLWGRFVRWLKS